MSGFLLGYLLVRCWRGLFAALIVAASLAFVGHSHLGWLPFLTVIVGLYWLRRRGQRRSARREQLIAGQQYRMMQLQADLNAEALHNLIGRQHQP